MEESTDNQLDSGFAGQSEERGDEGGVGPSQKDGMLLVHAFVSIKSPERRKAVLEYAIEQAIVDGR